MPTQDAEAVFKQFFDTVQESFAGGPGKVDKELLDRMIEQGTHTSRLYSEMMDIGLKAFNASLKEDPDKTAFKEYSKRASENYRAFYEAVLGKYLRMPPIGLGGKALQQILMAVDAYHQLMDSLNQFLQEFNLPLIASLEMFQERFDEKKDQVEHAKDLYDAFLEIVDKKYDTYLRSPDGVKRVADLIDRYLTFKQRLDAAMAPLLKFYNVPGKREMDDVYQRIHAVRKKNRVLETTLRKQGVEIDFLRKEIKVFKEAAREKKPRKAVKAVKKATRKKKRGAEPEEKAGTGSTP